MRLQEGTKTVNVNSEWDTVMWLYKPVICLMASCHFICVKSVWTEGKVWKWGRILGGVSIYYGILVLFPTLVLKKPKCATKRTVHLNKIWSFIPPARIYMAAIFLLISFLRRKQSITQDLSNCSVGKHT